MEMNTKYIIIAIIVIIGFITLIAGVALFSLNKYKKKNNTSTTRGDSKDDGLDQNSESY